MVSPCGFDLHFSDDLWCWAIFRVAVGHLYVFFGKMSIQVLCPFWNWTICFSAAVLYEVLVYFGYQPLRYVVCKYFFPFHKLPLIFFFCFLGLSLWHMEVPRLGVESELQLPAYTTAAATPDLSCICDLHCSSRQRRILTHWARPGSNPQTYVSSQIHFHRTMTGNSKLAFNFVHGFLCCAEAS